MGREQRRRRAPRGNAPSDSVQAGQVQHNGTKESLPSVIDQPEPGSKLTKDDNKARFHRVYAFLHGHFRTLTGAARINFVCIVV